MKHIGNENIELSEFSSRVREQILHDFPEWDNYSSLKNDYTNGNVVSIVFQIPIPIQANVDSDLLIYTMNEEITVCFDYYHSHFDDWRSTNDLEENTAYYFVKCLLDEKTGVISYWQDKEWKGSRQIVNKNDYQPGYKLIYNQIRIRSWNGNMNIDKSVT